MRRRLTALSLAALFVLGIATPADASVPLLRSITFSAAAVSVDGAEVKPLTVTVHLTDDTGITSAAVRVGRQMVPLSRTSGTPRKGVWTGTARVTTDWASGTYRPSRLRAHDTRGRAVVAHPRTKLPEVDVTSTNPPRIQLWDAGFTLPGDFVTQGLTLAGPRLPVAIGYGDQCTGESSSYAAGYPDERGDFRTTFTAGPDYTGEFCAWVVGDDADTRIGLVTGFIGYHYQPSGVVPARNAVVAGTDVPVTGVLRPFQAGKELLLQRHYPDGRWRTVNEGRTDAGAAFRILATPPSPGTNRYRVVAAEEPRRAVGRSLEFTIHGA